MIKNITDLRYYHESDRLACNKSAKVSLRERILSFLAPDYISEFLRELRIVEYLSNCSNRGIMGRAFLFYHRLKLRKIQLHLGFLYLLMFVVQDCPSLIMVLLLFQVKLRLDVTVEFIHAST